MIQKTCGASELLSCHLIRYRKFSEIKWFPVTAFVKMHTNKQPIWKPSICK